MLNDLRYALRMLERLVRVFGSQSQLALAPTAPANFLELKEENQVLERIGTYVGQGFNLLGGDKPERVIGSCVSADLLQLLGVQRRWAAYSPTRKTRTARARL